MFFTNVVSAKGCKSLSFPPLGTTFNWNNLITKSFSYYILNLFLFFF